MNGGMRVAAYEKSKSVKLKSISTMTEGTIWRQIFLFSIPLILGNLLQQMYNTVDSIIVGNFVGSNALAAVGSSTSLICLLIAFSMGASAGAGVIVSQFYGAGDENGVQRSAHTALMLALILGIVLTIAGIVFSPAILRWMRTPEEVMNQSVLYLRIYSYGLVFNVIYNMAAGILNAVGNSRRSLMYLAVASFFQYFSGFMAYRRNAHGSRGCCNCNRYQPGTFLHFCIMVFDESSGYLPHKSEETFH